MYSRKRPDSHRFMGGRSRVFRFDFESLDTCLFSTTVKVVGTVAHQWMYLIINIQRSSTPCLRNMPHSVIIWFKYSHGWIMAYTMCPFVGRLFFLSPTAHSQIVAQQRPTPKCTITASQLVASFIQCFFFGIFFHWMRLSNAYCWRHLALIWSPPRLILVPQLISDLVSNTHQLPRAV